MSNIIRERDARELRGASWAKCFAQLWGRGAAGGSGVGAVSAPPNGGVALVASADGSVACGGGGEESRSGGAPVPWAMSMMRSVLGQAGGDVEHSGAMENDELDATDLNRRTVHCSQPNPYPSCGSSPVAWPLGSSLRVRARSAAPPEPPAPGKDDVRPVVGAGVD